MDEYLSYRIFLVDSSQEELFKGDQSKESILRELLSTIERRGKYEFIDNDVRYLFCFIKQYSNQFYILQLAREERFAKPSEREKRVETVEDKRYPFIYVIFDLKRQIILIQHKSSVFQDIDTAKSKIERFFYNNFTGYGLITTIKEMFSGLAFWEQLQQYDEIFLFDLTLTGPNLFGARYRASDLSKDIHDNYNASEFNIKLKNSLGKLKLLKDNISDYITLAATGAGKFVAEVAKKGIKERIGSFTYILKKHYDKDIDKVTLNQLNIDFEELDKHNDDKK